MPGLETIVLICTVIVLVVVFTLISLQAKPEPPQYREEAPRHDRAVKGKIRVTIEPHDQLMYIAVQDNNGLYCETTTSFPYHDDIAFCTDKYNNLFVAHRQRLIGFNIAHGGVHHVATTHHRIEDANEVTVDEETMCVKVSNEAGDYFRVRWNKGFIPLGNLYHTS